MVSRPPLPFPLTLRKKPSQPLNPRHHRAAKTPAALPLLLLLTSIPLLAQSPSPSPIPPLHHPPPPPPPPPPPYCHNSPTLSHPNHFSTPQLHLRQWQQIPPHELDWLRKKARKLRKQTEQRLLQALQAAGANPSPDQLQPLLQQFWLERAELERQLRKQFHEERQKKEEQLIQKFVEEFIQNLNPSPSPSPSPTPIPQNQE